LKPLVSVNVPEEVYAALEGRPLTSTVWHAAQSLAAGKPDQAEAIVRRRLMRADAAADPASARAAFIYLLYLLHQQRKHEEIAAALCAPWSPMHNGGDPDFDRMYGAAISATRSNPLPFKRSQRFRELVRLLSSTRRVGGELAECGCYRGLSSHLLCQALAAESPTFGGAGFHIFDSFEGLSAPAPEDAIPEAHPDRERLAVMTKTGRFAASLETVQRNLARFPAITYHRGWIPFSFENLPERQYRFVHLDVDLYNPTRDSLAYFHRRVAMGGMIVSDDYSWPGARRAIEEFCAQNALRFTVTDFEQAVIRL